MSDPRIWGSDVWKTLHRYSLAYPRQRPSDAMKRAARDFYASHRELLPCPWCRHHYAKYFDETFTDETVGSRKALVKWVFDLHNEVNRRLGKPVRDDITVDDLPRLYNSFPMRYVDLRTGDLLDVPRYDTTGGRDNPADEEAIERLEQNVASSKTGTRTGTGVAQQAPSFWATPLGVSLIWLTALTALLALVAVALLVRYYVNRRNRRDAARSAQRQEIAKTSTRADNVISSGWAPSSTLRAS